MSDVKIPKINPIRLLDINDQIHRFFVDSIPSHEEFKRYCQKVQRSDVLNCLVASDSTAEIYPTGELLDCHGNHVADITMNYVGTAISGYDWWSFSADFVSIIDGIYYFYIYWLPADPSDGTAKLYEFISEPVWVKNLWENTILFSYYNTDTDFDFIFSDLGTPGDFICSVRVEGGWPSDGFSPKSKDELYIDEEYVPVQLSSKPFNTQKIIFGGSYGIPNWLIDIINRGLSCDHTYIDLLQVVKAEGAKLERSGEKLYPMAAWSLELMESDYNFSTGSEPVITLLGYGETAFNDISHLFYLTS
jgi:hypothetical protein